MKKSIFKSIIFISLIIIIFSFNFVFAAGEQTVIANLSNKVLSIFMWTGYAVGLGAIIFIGIKYVMSGANEKASLKGILPKYFIGIVAILFCFTIAKWVADLAGNDTAEEIIGVGEEAGDYMGSTTNVGEGTSDESEVGTITGGESATLTNPDGSLSNIEILEK